MSEEKNAFRRRGGKRGHGGPGAGMMPGEKAKDFKGTMKTLAGYLKPYKFRLAAVIVFAVASTVFTIISPAVLERLPTRWLKASWEGVWISVDWESFSLSFWECTDSASFSEWPRGG